MRNSETRITETVPDDAGLFQLFNDARLDERKSSAFAVSIRMEALAIHILKEGMNGVEAAELLRRERQQQQSGASPQQNDGLRKRTGADRRNARRLRRVLYNY